MLHEDGRAGGCRWSCDIHIQAAAYGAGMLALGLSCSVQLLALQQQRASWRLQATQELPLGEQVSAVALSEAAGPQVRPLLFCFC